MHRGHPFLHVCGLPGATEVLRRFGFRPFAPPIDDTRTWPSRPESVADAAWPSTCATDRRSLDALAAEVKRLLALPGASWAAAEGVAAANQRHFACRGGFQAALERHARLVLRFAADPVAFASTAGGTEGAASVGGGRDGRKDGQGAETEVLDTLLDADADAGALAVPSRRKRPGPPQPQPQPQ